MTPRTNRLYLFIFLCAHTPDFSMATAPRDRPGEASKPEAARTRVELSLKQFITLVHERNDRIAFVTQERRIKRDAIVSARSTLEAELAGSSEHRESSVRNTVEESSRRSALGEFLEYNDTHDVAVESLSPAGGKTRLGYTLSRFNNNLQRDPATGIDSFDEYRGFLGISITQPLLKGRGRDSTMASIRVAESEHRIADHDYRRELSSVVAQAITAYVDLHHAQATLDIREESIRVNSAILEDNRSQVRRGLIPATEVMEAEAGLARRRYLAAEARQGLIIASNRMRDMMVGSAARDRVLLVATEIPSAHTGEMDFASSLRRAFDSDPLRRAVLEKVKREGVRVAYARNQRWPQLDMKTSYGLNGLSTTPGRSWNDLWDRDHPTWSASMEMRVPLGGSTRGKAELSAAKARRRQVLIELEATEARLANALDAAISRVEEYSASRENTLQVVSLRQSLLEAALATRQAGLGNSRQVLECEDSLNRAREEDALARVSLDKAVFELWRSEGSLFERIGMTDIKDTETP